MSDIRIIPAILTSDRLDLLEKLRRVDGVASRVQVDLIGKAFSSEVTVGVEALEEIEIGVALDVQLMVREPARLLNRCDMVGTDRVYGHVEYMQDQQDFIEHAFGIGMQVGLGLDLETAVGVIEKSLAQLDSVLLMAVPAGKSGQKFDMKVLKKINELRELMPEISICIDGGVNPKTIGACVEAGANEFAVNSFLWESKDIKVAIGELLEAAR